MSIKVNKHGYKLMTNNQQLMLIFIFGNICCILSKLQQRKENSSDYWRSWIYWTSCAGGIYRLSLEIKDGMSCRDSKNKSSLILGFPEQD